MKKETLKLTGAWADAFGEPSNGLAFGLFGAIVVTGKAALSCSFVKSWQSLGGWLMTASKKGCEPHHAEHAPPFQHGRGKPPFPAA